MLRLPVLPRPWHALALVAAIVIAPRRASAQGPLAQPGTMVRLTVSGVATMPQGTLLAVRPDTVVIATRGPDPARWERARITRLEVLAAPGRRRAELIGAATGVVVGGAIGYSIARLGDPPGDAGYRGEPMGRGEAIAGVVIGAMLGGSGGAVIGRRRVPARWYEARLASTRHGLAIALRI